MSLSEIHLDTFLVIFDLPNERNEFESKIYNVIPI